MDMCLVLDLVMSAKFKTPEFEKYKDNLGGALIKWYMRLEKSRILSWQYLVDAFLKRYKYNLDMEPNRRQL